MSKLSFSYQLNGHGWANAVFRFGNTHYQFAASYIDTPLETLLLALLWFAGKGKRLPWIVYSERNGNLTCSFRWQGEPTTLCWDLVLTPPRSLQIKLREAEDWEAPPTEPPTLKVTQDYFAFCRIILHGLDQMLRTHGAAGYEAAWGKAFPMKEYEALRQIASSPAGSG